MISTAVSAVTALGTTLIVPPVTIAGTVNTAALLEKAVYVPLPPDTVKLAGKSGNTTAVAGLIANAVPVNLTVTFAVADALSESRTVMSIAVSAATPLGVTVNVEPDTFVVIGNTPLLLENTV